MLVKPSIRHSRRSIQRGYGLHDEVHEAADKKTRQIDAIEQVLDLRTHIVFHIGFSNIITANLILVTASYTHTPLLR